MRYADALELEVALVTDTPYEVVAGARFRQKADCALAGWAKLTGRRPLHCHA